MVAVLVSLLLISCGAQSTNEPDPDPSLIPSVRASGPAPAPPTPPKAAAAGQADGDVSCTREALIGSRVGEKVCRSQRAEAEQRQDDRRDLERRQTQLRPR